MAGFWTVGHKAAVLLGVGAASGPRSRRRYSNWRRRFSESEPIRLSTLQSVTLSTTAWRGCLLFSRQIKIPDLLAYEESQI